MWGVIAMCAKTDLYGFGRHGPGHYWRPEVVDYARHNMYLEHKAFFNLAAESYGKVTVAW